MKAQASYSPSFSQDLLLIFSGDHYNPHSVIGLHDFFEGQKVIRLWRPGAKKAHLEVFGKVEEARRLDEAGLFEFSVPSHTTGNDYKIYHQNGLLANDPYAFMPTIGELDQHLFNQGVHYNLYHLLGAHLMTHQGVQGVRFAVWAPGAKRVSLVGDFNYWDGRVNPMRSMGHSGLWEIFVPGLTVGMKYKFEIKTAEGKLLLKADPQAYYSEQRPSTASIVFDVNRFQWEDHAWMNKRIEGQGQPHPLNVYEVHLGSWRKNGPYFKNYRELAVELAQYCKEMGYTHIELMPIQEHPLDESWGYQVSGMYAPTSRFGTPEDFQWFVNHCHQMELGVILDWVPGHFPVDDFSLGRFDGTALYEHEDPRQGFHPHWNTYIFNFDRKEVTNFLIANAIYWLEVMHVDGLRVDAVASMLYLDYGRNEGEWIPNKYGGKENLEAIEFIKHLNSIVHQRTPGILMIAEESTCFAGMTQSVEQGGLGFDLKWNMGWMNDSLRYMARDMFFRHHHQNELTFGLLYAFSEKFILVLSHDEVVHGKGSLISKMPGDLWQKFANLRLLLSYMMCHPGKKLLFMGGEIGQWNEWYCKAELEEFLLQYPTHRGVHDMVKEINHLYLNKGCLWERDFVPTGFEWVDFNDQYNSVITFIRKGAWDRVLCVCNFTPNYHAEYNILYHGIDTIREIFNSDDTRFGGSGKINSSPHIIHDGEGRQIGVRIQLAPLATMIFEI